MASFVVSPEAEEDLDRIWRYLLSEAGLATANRIQSALLEAFAGLAESPGQGHKRSDLTERNVLFYSVFQYMVVYRRAPVVEIVGVLHAKRNLERVLKGRLPKPE